MYDTSITDTQWFFTPGSLTMMMIRGYYYCLLSPNDLSIFSHHYAYKYSHTQIMYMCLYISVLTVVSLSVTLISNSVRGLSSPSSTTILPNDTTGRESSTGIILTRNDWVSYGKRTKDQAAQSVDLSKCIRVQISMASGFWLQRLMWQERPLWVKIGNWIATGLVTPFWHPDWTNKMSQVYLIDQ